MRPSEGDYAKYYQRYIDKVHGDDFLSVMAQQLGDMENILANLPEEKALFAYAEDKWTVKELLGHIIDAERVFSYRALCIARGEQQPLPGFEQDEFVKTARFNKRDLESIVEEYRHLRRANIALFSSFTDEELNRKGTASGNPVTVRALMFIIAGHEKHHIDILLEKYL